MESILAGTLSPSVSVASEPRERENACSVPDREHRLCERREKDYEHWGSEIIRSGGYRGAVTTICGMKLPFHQSNAPQTPRTPRSCLHSTGISLRTNENFTRSFARRNSTMGGIAASPAFDR